MTANSETQDLPDEMPGRIVRLRWQMDVFEEQLAALGDILTVVAPRAADLDSPEIRLKPFIEELAAVPEDSRAEVAEAFRVAMESDERPNPSKVIDGLIKRHQDELWVYQLWSAAHKVEKAASRAEVLHGSILASTVGAYEVLLAGVLSYFLEARPEAVSALGGTVKEKEFSLSELESFGSIEEARASAIGRRVDGFLFESFISWSKWFENNLKFGFSEVCINWEQLLEMVERRHVIVHNGGRVSRRYQANLGLTESEAASGSKLQVDDNYALRAISQFRVLGTLVAVLTWIKVDSTWARSATSILNNSTYEQLVAGDWEAARCLAQAASRLKLDEDTRLVFLVNEWIARSRLGESIADEVEGVDFSACASKFRLAKVVLLGELDASFAHLDECLRTGDLGFDALFEWPLLEPMRADRRYRMLISDRYETLKERDGESLRQYAEVVMPASGDKFHLASCRYASGSVALPRSTAASLGLAPCGICIGAHE